MNNDFDFLLGRWRVMNRRLTNWLGGSGRWEEFESSHEERKLNSGAGNVAYHQFVLDRVPYERTVLRSYNPTLDFWKIDRLNGMTNLVTSPLLGTFWQNKGSFISKGYLDTRSVLVWVEWTCIGDSFASWEQALSADQGETWETNWVMDFFRK